VAPATPQGVVHGPRLETPEREVRAACPWGERPRTVAPPSALDARDWQGEIGASSNQNAGVHHAVLFGADELVSLQDQDSQGSLIHDAKLGYAAGFVQLLYVQRSCLEGTFEEVDILLRMGVTLQRKYVQQAVGDGSTYLQALQCSCEGFVHVVCPFRTVFAAPALTTHLGSQPIYVVRSAP
jgi:hypothetical protein